MRGRDTNDQYFGSGLHRIGVVTDFLRLSGSRDIAKIEPFLHPEVEVVATTGVAPPRPRPGRDGFLGYIRGTKAIGLLMEPDAYEIHACLSGKVLVAGALRLTSSQEVSETSIFYVYTFRDGLIYRFESYLDRETAEDAAGTLDLDEGAPS